jgi:hypothetical protein
MCTLFVVSASLSVKCLSDVIDVIDAYCNGMRYKKRLDCGFECRSRHSCTSAFSVLSCSCDGPISIQGVLSYV